MCESWLFQLPLKEDEKFYVCVVIFNLEEKR